MCRTALETLICCLEAVTKSTQSKISKTLCVKLRRRFPPPPVILEPRRHHLCVSRVQIYSAPSLVSSIRRWSTVIAEARSTRLACFQASSACRCWSIVITQTSPPAIIIIPRSPHTTCQVRRRLLSQIHYSKLDEPSSFVVDTIVGVVLSLALAPWSLCATTGVFIPISIHVSVASSPPQPASPRVHHVNHMRAIPSPNPRCKPGAPSPP